MRRLHKEGSYDVASRPILNCSRQAGCSNIHPLISKFILPFGLWFQHPQMNDFIEQPAFEIGRRLEIRGSDVWCVALKPSGADATTLADFAADLSAVLGQQVRIIEALPLSVDRLCKDLSEPDSDPVLVSAWEQADDAMWRDLDINRSGLSRPGPVILWLSATALARLCNRAPNLRSFVGGSIFLLGSHGQAMTPSERQKEIAELESHYEMSSQEMLRLAESGTLPADTHFVEWLVLLERGDLV